MKTKLLDRIQPFLNKRQIDTYAVLPASECPPDLQFLARKHIEFIPKSYLIILLPYFVSFGDNLSVYATSKDYHQFAQSFGEELVIQLRKEVHNASFRFFCDKSPIDERRAAVRAGLGVFGDNGLLISHAYGSYVFISEVVSSLDAEEWGTFTVSSLHGCLHCGACKQSCPTGCLSDHTHPCLSALTQKKGKLTYEEERILLRSDSVWGCDKCQKNCPLNHPGSEIKTPIRFFYDDRILRLDKQVIDSMDENAFKKRAFSWRGREVLLRNMMLFEEKKQTPSVENTNT